MMVHDHGGVCCAVYGMRHAVQDTAGMDMLLYLYGVCMAYAYSTGKWVKFTQPQYCHVRK